MKSKFLSIVVFAFMVLLFMSVSKSDVSSESESLRKFWGSESISRTECGESNTGTFCCTTTTTTTYYVFWIAMSHDYSIEVECI